MTPAPADAVSATLERIEIRSPCTVPWASMRGDERTRFCTQCRQSVHDISQMSRREADRLLASKSGRLCLRIQRRADGTVVTQDCGPLRRAVRRKALLVRTAAAAFLALLFPGALAGCGAQTTSSPVVPPEDPRQLQGEVCAPMMGTPVTPPEAGDPEPEMGDFEMPEDKAPEDKAPEAPIPDGAK